MIHLRVIMTLLLIGLMLSLTFCYPQTTEAKSTQKKATTTETRGWIDGKYVRVQSKTNKKGETTTTGWVDGKRVRTKTKEKK